MTTTKPIIGNQDIINFILWVNSLPDGSYFRSKEYGHVIDRGDKVSALSRLKANGCIKKISTRDGTIYVKAHSYTYFNRLKTD